MEGKLIPAYRLKQKYNISDKKLMKIFETMNRRHRQDHWVIKRKNGTGVLETYIYLEGVDWIDKVYYRTSGNYLDAEIKFVEEHIMRLKKEISYEPMSIKKEMNIKELCSYFGRKQRSIRYAISLMEQADEDYKYTKNGMTYVKAEGVDWLAINIYRTKYLEEQQYIKRELQMIKRERK